MVSIRLLLFRYMYSQYSVPCMNEAVRHKLYVCIGLYRTRQLDPGRSVGHARCSARSRTMLCMHIYIVRMRPSVLTVDVLHPIFPLLTLPLPQGPCGTSGISLPSRSSGARETQNLQAGMAATSSSSAPAVGKHDTTGWEAEDIQHHDECLALSVLDQFWTPDKWMTFKGKTGARKGPAMLSSVDTVNIIRASSSARAMTASPSWASTTSCTYSRALVICTLLCMSPPPVTTTMRRATRRYCGSKVLLLSLATLRRPHSSQ